MQIKLLFGEKKETPVDIKLEGEIQIEQPPMKDYLEYVEKENEKRIKKQITNFLLTIIPPGNCQSLFYNFNEDMGKTYAREKLTDYLYSQLQKDK